METHKVPLATSIPPGTAFGRVSNGGTQRYLLEAESTTGCVAWQIADGTILVSQAEQVSLPATASVTFWSCAAFQDTTPAGAISTFDCHGNALVEVDVRALQSLEYLDCSYNDLRELDLGLLPELQALDVDDNHLTKLEVRQLGDLRVLNCAGNGLKELDLSGLGSLEILDCSSNQISSLLLEGCASLKDVKADNIASHG